jgi:hypothetical protein
MAITWGLTHPGRGEPKRVQPSTARADTPGKKA